jgi:glycosyltransferase A (GT-A) superfamily protein (DUF2064 family)
VRLVAQEGADLRIRLDRVLTDLLAESGSGAIAIDTDSPTLPTDYLRQACACLAEATADVVIGPSEDGGYYLMPPWFDVDRGEDLSRLRESAAMPGAYRAARSLAFLDRELAY